ncbi:TDE2508 family outer membrane beta-barrel protein [Treponema sp. R6D11]
MKNKTLTFALLMLMITAIGAWAQNLPASIWTSPQSSTTEGRYRSNADDFIRPDAYTGVKFNKWFGIVSFLNDEKMGPIATAGFATKIRKVYIGTFYSGNMWSNAPINNYTEEVPNTIPKGGDADKAYNVYPFSPSAGDLSNPVNNVAILIGVADMGFRLTYRTNYQFFKDDNIVFSEQLYKNWQVEWGYIAPQIAWAMAKDLTGNGIRPYVTVDLVFTRDYEKREASGAVNGNTGEEIVRSLNHFDPSLSAGLGGYTFYNQDGFKASADFDYVLTLNIYDNEYSYTEDGKYKTGKIKGTFSPGSFKYNERSFISNSFTPSVSGSWSKDALALKFKFNMPLTFSNEEQNGMDLNSSNKLVYHLDSESTSTFTLRPDLRLAMQYKIVPNKLTLNVGAKIQTTAAKLETVDKKIYEYGTKKASKKQHKDAVNGTFASQFSIGPTLNFAENAWIEATTGVKDKAGDSFDVFASGGLFTFGSILLAFKF